jgi:hypothetical protein
MISSKQSSVTNKGGMASNRPEKVERKLYGKP